MFANRIVFIVYVLDFSFGASQIFAYKLIRYFHIGISSGRSIKRWSYSSFTISLVILIKNPQQKWNTSLLSLFWLLSLELLWVKNNNKFCGFFPWTIAVFFLGYSAIDRNRWFLSYHIFLSQFLGFQKQFSEKSIYDIPTQNLRTVQVWRELVIRKKRNRSAVFGTSSRLNGQKYVQ